MASYREEAYERERRTLINLALHKEPNQEEKAAATPRSLLALPLQLPIRIIRNVRIDDWRPVVIVLALWPLLIGGIWAWSFLSSEPEADVGSPTQGIAERVAAEGEAKEYRNKPGQACKGADREDLVACLDLHINGLRMEIQELHEEIDSYGPGGSYYFDDRADEQSGGYPGP